MFCVCKIVKCLTAKEVIDPMKYFKRFQLVIRDSVGDDKIPCEVESGRWGCVSGREVISAGTDHSKSLCITFGESSLKRHWWNLNLHQVSYNLPEIIFVLCWILWLRWLISSYLTLFGGVTSVKTQYLLTRQWEYLYLSGGGGTVLHMTNY